MSEHAASGFDFHSVLDCAHPTKFIKARNEDVNEAVIRRATAGMKEADSSVSNALNNIFNPLSKKVVKDLGLGEEEESRYIARLVREIDAVGRESTLASGKSAWRITERHSLTILHRLLRTLRHETAT